MQIFEFTTYFPHRCNQVQIQHIQHFLQQQNLSQEDLLEIKNLDMLFHTMFQLLIHKILLTLHGMIMIEYV